MTSLYRVELTQHDRNGLLWNRETFDMKARTGTEALRRALAAAKGNGFLKSKTIEVESMIRLSKNVR